MVIVAAIDSPDAFCALLPQGLKPSSFAGIGGMAKIMPAQNHAHPKSLMRRRSGLRRPAKKLQGFRNSFASGAHAIGNTDAAIAVSSKGHARRLSQQPLNSIQTIKMADAVLRHGSAPLLNADGYWFRAQSENFI